jgi:hypothetical protein
VRRLGLVLVVLAACRSGRRAADPGRRAADPGLRDRARLVLESHCGGCHTGGWDQAPARALAIFDLTQPEYFGHMSKGQLASVLSRLGPGAPPIDPHDNRPVSPTERATVTAYVATLGQ